MDEKGWRGKRREAPFSRSDERHRSTLNVFRLSMLDPYDLLGREKRMERSRGGEGKVLMTYERKDHPWRSNPAVLPHGFTQKSYLSRSLPACHPVPPLCARRGGREPLLLILEPAAVTLDRVIASQRGIYCDGWREREREIKSSDSNLSVSAFEHISLCKFRPLRRLPCLLSNKIPKILWILLEYSYPLFLFIHQFKTTTLRQKKKRKER